MSDGLGIKEALPEKTGRSPNADDTADVLEKLRKIELLPDVFALMQSLQQGELQAKDFDNNAGAVRLKASTVRLYLQEVDGICESTEEREKRIAALALSNDKKRRFLAQFRANVLKDLGS